MSFVGASSFKAAAPSSFQPPQAGQAPESFRVAEERGGDGTARARRARITVELDGKETGR